MAAIYDWKNGDPLALGLQGSDECDQAINLAKELAAERGESVHLDDDDGEWEVRPNGTSHRLRGPVEERCEHCRLDCSSYELELGWPLTDDGIRLCSDCHSYSECTACEEIRHAKDCARPGLCRECQSKLDAIELALNKDGYDARRGDPDGDSLVLSGMAPDSDDYDGITEPGSPWDEACDEILADIESMASPLGGEAEWRDDDIIITLVGA